MRMLAFAAMLMCAAPASALCEASKDMNGTWRGNDGGIYYVRQVGSNVWWLGVSAKDDGKTFSNVSGGRSRTASCSAHGPMYEGRRRGPGRWK